MQQSDDYVNSHYYENYIRLARLCGRDEFGAHNQNMLNLILKERSDDAVTGINLQKLSEKIRRNLLAATRHAIKRKIEPGDKALLKSYLPLLTSAASSADLIRVCKEGVEVLLKYKPNS